MHAHYTVHYNYCVHIRQNSSYWVKDLDLRTGDKDVVLAESGMLSDCHMYAAHKLMRMQFPNIEGCYSTLLIQKMSFPAVTSSEATGIISIVVLLIYIIIPHPHPWPYIIIIII